MASFHRLTTPFKLFWLLAVFGSLSAVVAADDKPEAEISVGGLPSDEVVHNQIYNISWGGRNNLSTISMYLSQVPDANWNQTQKLDQHPLVENTTENPFRWNVTLPVGTIWSLNFSSKAFTNTTMGFGPFHVVSKTSAAGKVLATSSSTLAFLVLAFAAMTHL